jgi:hypothetical protein
MILAVGLLPSVNGTLNPWNNTNFDLYHQSVILTFSAMQ